MILALDTSSSTGAAWGEIGGSPEWEVIKFKGEFGEKVSRFRFWLNSKIGEVRPQVLAYEAPYVPVPRAPKFVKSGTLVPVPIGGAPPMNAETIELLCTLVGLVREIAFERGIEPMRVTTLQATQYFTGTTRHGGRAKKKAATIARCRQLGWETASDDVADALAVFAFAEGRLDPIIASRRAAGAGEQLPLHGVLPTQQRIGRRLLS